MNTSRKANVYDGIVTLVEVTSGFSRRMFPPGTIGTIVDCYDEPEEGYAVDLAVPDDTLVGGFAYDNVILLPHQFRVVPDGEGNPGNGDDGTDEG